MDSKTALQQGTVISVSILSLADCHLCFCFSFSCHSLLHKNNLLTQLFASFQQQGTNISQRISRFWMPQWVLTAESNTKLSCFANAPDWQWLQPDIYSTTGTGCIRCEGIFSPMSLIIASLRLYMLERVCVCLRTICASRIRCNSVDNVWFLSGNWPQKLKRHFA